MTTTPDPIAAIERAKRVWVYRDANYQRRWTTSPKTGAEEFVHADDHAILARQSAEKDAEIARLRKALKPFAKFAETSSLFKHRIFLQLLVCPDGDDHPEDYRPHFRRARTLLENSDAE